MDNNRIREIFQKHKSIAVVGFSDNRSRPSNRIGRYLQGNGYHIFGINPRLNKLIVDDIPCFDSILSIPIEVRIINVFRRSEFLFDLIKEILLLKCKPSVIWTQVGVVDNDAKLLAESNGLIYIENKCIMTEHQKYI
ncbi:MAG: putative protein YccU [Ignavibacteria bacterium]|nr:putative protein YccU [Ignavibacteria bacterium]